MAKTVLITGSSKGIGAATAILFATKGYNVVINYNNSYQSASLLCQSLVSNGYSVMTHKANVANRLEVELMVKETLYKFGSIDILVNNAGIAHQGCFYAILQPVELIEGMADDEALVFKVSRSENGEDKFEIELDDSVVDAVFAEYNKLYEEAHAGGKK